MSVALVLEMAAEAHGDRPALRLDDGTVLDFAAYRDRVAAAAATLRTSGAQRVAMLSDATAAFPVTLFAAAWAGLPFAPVNHRLPVEQTRALLDRLPGSVVVTDIGTPATTRLPVLTPAELFAAGGGADAAPTGPDDVAVELFTSGTTGPPTLAALTNGNLFGYVTGTVELGGAAPGEALLLATPPFHIAAVAAVLSACYAGRALHPAGRFGPAEWLRAAASGATHAFVVPTMLARILDALDADPALPVPTLRSIAYGGARMPRPTLERALTALPGTDFVNAYGLTETSSTIAVLGPDEHRAALAGALAAVRRLASVGRAVPGVEIRVVDAAGEPVAPGVSGAVEVRGEQVAATGWLRTGDAGSLDADGYLFLDGRADDVIIKGGENISPGEVEDVLLTHPAVAAAAVVGVPDPEWGERIAAAVVLRGGAAGEPDLRTWTRARIGSLKAPDVVRVVAALPETATGKVVRAGVRDMLAAHP